MSTTAQVFIAVLTAAIAQGQTRAPFGTGPGAWPVKGAIYEVCPEYFPNHSLKELTAEMPRLEKLGISVIYVTPIFQFVGTAQYWIVNYYNISPRYGTAADLHDLVNSAHQHGIKVLLDLVTSIAIDGSDIVTKHPDWIIRGDDGSKQHYYPIPVFGWALDTTNPELITYFTDIARYYVSTFDIDGWRVDSPTDNYDTSKVSGDHTRLKLLNSVRNAITAAKKSAVMIAEVSGPDLFWGKNRSHPEPLFDAMCEASYNYESCGFLGGNEKSGYGYWLFDGTPAEGRFKPALFNRIVHNEMSSGDFVKAIQAQPILYSRLRANFIENHDTDRVSKAFPNQHRALFVMIAAIPGIPVVHAGQEIGSTVKPSVSGGETVVKWQQRDRSLESFYAKVLEVRAGNQALLTGDLRDAWKSGDRVIAFSRRSALSRVLVALNFGSKTSHCAIAISGAGSGLALELAYLLRDELTGETMTRTGKMLENLDLSLPPYGFRVFSIAASK